MTSLLYFTISDTDCAPNYTLVKGIGNQIGGAIEYQTLASCHKLCQDHNTCESFSLHRRGFFDDTGGLKNLLFSMSQGFYVFCPF